MKTQLVKQEALLPAEKAELVELETQIERGLTTFVEVGQALTTIREDRLYRTEYKTFEDYCRQRWNMSRIHAHRLIDAADVVKNLLPTGNIDQPIQFRNSQFNVAVTPRLPTTEWQVRPLAALPPEDQPKAWARAVEASGGQPTARHVEAAVEEVKPRPAAPTPAEPVPPDPRRLDVLYSSKSVEHYTPREILDAAVKCMGWIDLDPCAETKVKPNVPAKHHFTREDDGLMQQWHGRVFLNPPYARGIIGPWIERLCAEHEAGRTTQAIALVPARVDTQWFAQLRDFPVCFISGRLTFIGNEDPAGFPSAVFYLGPDVEAFYHAFSPLGDVWQRIEPGMFGE